jgi:cytoskeleton protein RodZ
MESLGKYLKLKRDLRNLSLREVAKSTRIKENFLRAIEEDRYELLPPAIYVKGFLTIYAKYLSLDPHDVVLRIKTI